MPPINDDATKQIILISHSVIPSSEPGIAFGTADNGGYIVQPPLSGTFSTKNELSIITQARKKNQYESIFINGEAISRAPTCNGISRLLKVPLKPAVNTKNTIMVPCMVTSER